MKLILITNDPALAHQAEVAGVDRIMVDLEILGKQERQGHLNTLISSHSIDDIESIAGVLDRAQLMVRLNPLHYGTGDEIEQAIDKGGDLLMLPMFSRTEEVAECCRLVGGRAGVIPLVETRAAVASLDEVLDLEGVAEIYIGLNDLHLDLGLSFMFEPLATGMIDPMADKIRQAGLPFGFGGVARIGEGAVPAEMILAEHARLGSSRVILSRTFQHDLIGGEVGSLAREVEKLRTCLRQASSRDSGRIEADRLRLVEAVRAYIAARRDETTA